MSNFIKMPRSSRNKSRSNSYSRNNYENQVDWQASERRTGNWKKWGMWLLIAILVFAFLVWLSQYTRPFMSQSNGYQSQYGSPSSFATSGYTQKSCYDGRVSSIFSAGNNLQDTTVSACARAAQMANGRYFGLGYNKRNEFACFYSKPEETSTFDTMFSGGGIGSESCRTSFGDMVGDINTTAVYQLN